MRALLCTKYGSVSDLRLFEVAQPVPTEKEVLIKIYATAVNDYDWSVVTGKPYVYRLLFGIVKPKNPIPGMELAGVVEAIGSGVTRFKEADEVYGDISNYGFGSFAEFVCIHENAVVPKPAFMSFEDAAAIPHATMLAYQAIIEKGRIETGQKILINGAGGGVGTFGLQIAKTFGAEVTGVDAGEKLEAMSALGFDQVINYQQQDFTRNGKLYDLIIDAKTNRSPFAYLRSLQKKGKYVTVGGSVIKILQVLLFKFWIGLFTKKQLHIVVLKSNRDLQYIQDLYAAGKIRPVIEGPFNFSESAAAIQHFGKAKHTGKVVVTMESEPV